MSKKQTVEEVEVEYQVYPGAYPVVIFDLTKATKPTKDVSFNLTEFVKEYNLDVEKTCWLFYRKSESSSASYHLRTAYRSKDDEQISWRVRNIGDYYIPDILVGALLSRYNLTPIPPISGTIKTPVIDLEFPLRRLRHPRNSRKLKDFL